MVYEPGGTSLVCPYCGTRQAIEPEGRVDEQNYQQFLAEQASHLTVANAEALEVRCERCGAVVEFTPPEVAGECAFCGSQIVALPKAADPTIAPNAVLPFSLQQLEATSAIKQWLSSRWFAPNALKKLARQEAVTGIYLPFWTYDAYTASDYTGQRGEHYYTTETYTTTNSQGQQVTQTRQVQHTRWYPASGHVERAFDDVLIAATTNVSTKFLGRLEPWDLGHVKPYEPAYLSGFKAQRYQVDLASGFEYAKAVMADPIREDARRDIGGDEQRVESVETSYSDVTFKHLLLPVYLAAYQFNQKTYQVMVNAQTGEVTGDRPYSWIKITLFILMIVAVVALLALVFSNR